MLMAVLGLLLVAATVNATSASASLNNITSPFAMGFKSLAAGFDSTTPLSCPAPIGGRLVQATCGGTTSYIYKGDPKIAGRIEVRTNGSDSGSCLQAASATQGSGVVVAACSTAPTSQQWTFLDVSPAEKTAQLALANTNLCLTAFLVRDNFGQIADQLWPCKAVPNQVLTVTPFYGGRIKTSGYATVLQGSVLFPVAFHSITVEGTDVFGEHVVQTLSPDVNISPTFGLAQGSYTATYDAGANVDRWSGQSSTPQLPNGPVDLFRTYAFSGIVIGPGSATSYAVAVYCRLSS